MSTDGFTRSAIQNLAASGGLLDQWGQLRGAIPTYRNHNPNFLLKWKSALARGFLGGTPPKIALIGDSTFAGQGAGQNVGGSNGGLDARSFDPATQLAKLLSASGRAATSDATFGDSMIPGYGSTTGETYRIQTLDTRVSFGSTAYWSMFASGYAMMSLGGNLYQNANGDTTPMIWTPRSAANQFDIYYMSNSGLANWTVTDSSGTLATVAAGGGFQKLTVNRASASTLPINIQRTGTGTNLYIAGIVGRNTANSSIEVYNFGASGSATADWINTTNPWNPFNALATVSADLHIINLGLNDRGGGSVAPSTYQANMQTLITRCKTFGDVVLMRYVPPDTVWANGAKEPAYRQAIYDLSDANNVPLVDMTARWGTWAAANALGMMWDNPHPNARGYVDMAQALLEVVRPR